MERKMSYLNNIDKCDVKANYTRYSKSINQSINQSIYLVTCKQHSMTEITKTDKIAKMLHEH